MVDGPITEPVPAAADDALRDALDQLSRRVDAGNYERMRWARDEMPKLLRLVELVKGTVADRSDIEINEEGGEGNTKRFVIKVHGQRIAGLGVALEQGRALATIYAIDRSAFTVAEGETVQAWYDQIDEAWMAAKLSLLMARIGA